MDIKETVVEIAQSLGFQMCVIGSLKPMEKERIEFEQWLSKGYAAGMGYLKHNSHFRTSPQLLYPEAKIAIVVSASYYTEPPCDPGPAFGRVARYAVGLDYHEVLKTKLTEYKTQLERHLQRPLLGRCYTDDVALFEQGFAERSGLGFSGKNTLIIGPSLLGSYYFVAELFVDLEIEPDEIYKGTCGKCFRCGSACPTNAIVDGGVLDAGLCISYLTIENKGGIPVHLRPKLQNWLFGCDLCQEACPYNQRPPHTPWREFEPQSGVGHYLSCEELLKIKTQEEFALRFKGTAIRRAKRRGLLRNALVVLGNRCPDGAIGRIKEFAENESDAMLREHAAWAIAKYGDQGAKLAVEKLHSLEPDANSKQMMEKYLLEMF